MRRFLPLTILIVVIAGIIAAAWYWGDGDRWDRDHDRAHVVQAVDDQGQPVGNGTAVIIDRDGRPFFFPFGFLIVPLVFILVFWAIRTVFWRGGPGGPGGPGYAGPGGTPPPWFEHWYREMRRRDEQSASPQDRAG